MKKIKKKIKNKKKRKRTEGKGREGKGGEKTNPFSITGSNTDLMKNNCTEVLILNIEASEGKQILSS